MEQQPRHIHKVKPPKKKINWKPIASAVIIACGIIGGICGKLSYDEAGKKYQLHVKDTRIGTNTTRQGYYEYMLSKAGANSAVDEAYDSLGEKILKKSDYDNYIDSSLQSAKAQYKTLKKLYKEFNVSSKKEYVDKYLRDNAVSYLMKKKFIVDNQKLIRKKYNLIYVKTKEFSTEKEAEKFIKRNKSDSLDDRGALLNNLKNKSTENEFRDKIFKVADYKKDGFLKKPIKFKGNYYSVFVYNSKRPAQRIFNDIVKLDSKNKFNGIAKKYYLKKYHFKVTDRKLKKDIENKKLYTF